MTTAQALERLRGMVAASEAPALTEDELSETLASAVRVHAWAAGAVFLSGDLVLPSAFDPEAEGALYVATQAGICSDTEPAWPSTPYTDVFSGCVAFRLLGRYDGCQWDLEGAAHEGWLRKAGKVAGRHDFKDGDQSFTLSQQYDHCVAMADHFAPRGLF
jgi:hypothetical protein